MNTSERCSLGKGAQRTHYDNMTFREADANSLHCCDLLDGGPSSGEDDVGRASLAAESLRPAPLHNRRPLTAAVGRRRCSLVHRAVGQGCALKQPGFGGPFVGTCRFDQLRAFQIRKAPIRARQVRVDQAPTGQVEPGQLPSAPAGDLGNRL